MDRLLSVLMFQQLGARATKTSRRCHPSFSSRVARIAWSALVLVAVGLLPGCSWFSGDKPSGGTTSSTPSGSCAGSQEFDLTGAGSMDDPCRFDSVVLRNSRCKLISVKVEGSGGTLLPAGVIFEKDSASAEPSANRGTSPGDPWTASTNALACQSPPCADGRYTVSLKQLDPPVLCSQFGTVRLNLVLR